jgi:hypothetical protein
MTREEAITVLEGLSDNPLLGNQHKAAFNIAIHDIKAYHNWNINNLILVNKDNYEPLEQEPTTKNDLGVDCIDRAELLKAMDTWDKFGYTETGCFVRAPKNDYVPYVHYEDMVNCVKGMPTVTPQEPKTGHWIWCVGSHKCSNCEEYTCFSHKELLRYCPNCGAKMVEPQESEVENGND